MSTKLEFSQQISKQSSNIIFRENPSSGGRIVPRGQTDTDEAEEPIFAVLRTCQKFIPAPRNVSLNPWLLKICQQYNETAFCGAT
jgi:hypothetical protein